MLAVNSADKSALAKRLATIAKASRVGRQIEQNIQTEKNLPEAAKKDIFHSLLAQPNEESLLISAYVGTCRRHILKGPPAKGKRPKALGRAVAEDGYLEMLVDIGIYSSIRNARAKMSRALLKVPSVARKKIGGNMLGRHVQWATYCAADRKSNPFDSLPRDVEELMSSLGLPAPKPGKSVLLFVYEPKPGLKLRFPTIADAQDFPYFRPAPDDPDIECGLTCPIHDHLTPQPELVHEPTHCDCLSFPVERRFA